MSSPDFLKERAYGGAIWASGTVDADPFLPVSLPQEANVATDILGDWGVLGVLIWQRWLRETTAEFAEGNVSSERYDGVGDGDSDSEERGVFKWVVI